jgi:secondary thiamine-phosphate synthase enzyme
MHQKQQQFTFTTQGQGLYEFTAEARTFVERSGVRSGLLTLFCRHTSASLLIQENADEQVQSDLLEFFRRIVPEDSPWIVHRAEGPDDMPAHIKSALTQSSLSVPVVDGRPALGQWQGIYLFEHRSRRHEREVMMHVIGS